MARTPPHRWLIFSLVLLVNFLILFGMFLLLRWFIATFVLAMFL